MSPIVLTADGSHTLYDSRTGEHYHSTFGAVTESQHIFIKNGIAKIEKDTLSVFEAGFGTGLNALLTLQWSTENCKNVRYTAIEKFPVEPHELERLNYVSLPGTTTESFLSLHHTAWGSETRISEKFSLTLIQDDIRNIPDLPLQDIVYFDAFSPAVQPELWTEEIFARLYSLLYKGGMLVSYCVRGTVKQALRNTGFRVTVLPGPPGKRHMLLAVKE